ncbi:hypothetical protein Ancab_012143 [Ancistrocladus abbreviatus]
MCSKAERIVRNLVQNQRKVRPDIVPALLRLLFQDYFIEFLQKNLLGFDVIDLIKSEVEEVCPEVVSCANIFVLAARESIITVGRPFYPLLRARRDSALSFLELQPMSFPLPKMSCRRSQNTFHQEVLMKERLSLF